MNGYLVPGVEHMFEIFTHSMVLSCQKGGVENDAESDSGVEEHVMNNHEEHVLKAEPEAVVDTTTLAARPVTISPSL